MNLTYRWTNGEGDAVSAFLDEIDDVSVVEAVNIDMIHSEDTIAHL